MLHQKAMLVKYNRAASVPNPNPANSQSRVIAKTTEDSVELAKSPVEGQEPWPSAAAGDAYRIDPFDVPNPPCDQESGKKHCNFG